MLDCGQRFQRPPAIGSCRFGPRPVVEDEGDAWFCSWDWLDVDLGFMNRRILGRFLSLPRFSLCAVLARKNDAYAVLCRKYSQRVRCSGRPFELLAHGIGDAEYRSQHVPLAETVAVGISKVAFTKCREEIT